MSTEQTVQMYIRDLPLHEKYWYNIRVAGCQWPTRGGKFRGYRQDQRQVSGAWDELVRLIQETAERITDSGDTEEVSFDNLNDGDLILVPR